MGFGLVLFWASWKTIRDALAILLQGRPKDVDLNAVIDAILGVEGVVNVHHVHVWTLMSGRNVFSSHLLVRPSAVRERVLDQVYDLLTEGFGFFFATVQMEARCRRGEAAAGDRDRAGGGTGVRMRMPRVVSIGGTVPTCFGGADTMTLRIPRSSFLSACVGNRTGPSPPTTPVVQRVPAWEVRFTRNKILLETPHSHDGRRQRQAFGRSSVTRENRGWSPWIGTRRRCRWAGDDSRR